jgi:hypothetical protein
LASPLIAAGCALAALMFWTLVGAAIGFRVLPRGLVWPAAPSLGFAVHGAAAVPIFLAIGFSRTTVIAVAALSLLASLVALRRRPGEVHGMQRGNVPAGAYMVAGLLAVAPALAVTPFWSDGGVVLAAPIFDHSKVALIDGIARLGLSANPFFGENGEAGRIAYYYLWHLSAAQIAAALGASGWEADIALTWLTAVSSLCLVAGLASWFSGHAAAAYFALLFAATASLRLFARLLFGVPGLQDLLAGPTGFGGWLFQSAWVPQHLAAACCSVLAVLLIARLPKQRGWPTLAVLALLIAAGFESSTWIGGIVFPAAMVLVVPLVLWHSEPGERARLLAGLATVAILAGVVASPFLRDQLATLAARGGSPLAIRHREVLGNGIALPLRRLLDLPAYWLVFLVIEFPAFYVAGLVALAGQIVRHGENGETRGPTVAFAGLTGASLAIAWLGVSTLGDNNDLGLRAQLPAVLVLIVFAAAGLASWIAERRRFLAVVTALGLALGLPEAAAIVHENVAGRRHHGAVAFAQTPAMWAAVRRHAGSSERVANNPLFLQELTPWPVNLSWALLADRSSCFPGRELALAFAPLSPGRRDDIDAQFIRVFAGTGRAADVDDLALRYGCTVALVTAEDGAWIRDPFATSAHYRLAEEQAGRWRIYRRMLPAD